MCRIRLFIIILVLSVLHSVTGQAADDSYRISPGYPVYSQYLQNGLVINPAYAGTRGSLSTYLSYRMLWIGIKGAPVIQSLSLSAPMKNDKVGLGIVAQFMQFGLTKSSSIYADYAYYIKLKTGTLSLGLKVGAERSNTDYTGILLNNSGDPVFASNDKPYLLPNAGAGVYYFNDKLFAGISIPTFLSYRRTGPGSVQPYHSFREYDIIFSAGGLVPISQLLKFKPSMLLDYSFQETKKLTQFDLNGNLIISDLIWVGATWRVAPKGVAVGILQIQINPQLMFGFSYDFALGGMNSFTKGSSEFVLRYDFGSKVSAANPRYF